MILLKRFTGSAINFQPNEIYQKSAVKPLVMHAVRFLKPQWKDGKF